MSVLTHLADAVAGLINDGTYAVPFQAVRLHQPAFTLEDLATLRVTVVPRSIAISLGSRERALYECDIDIGVQKKLSGQQADGEIDGLLDLVEAISDRLRFTRLAAFPEAVWSGLANDPVISSESLEQHRVFMSVLTAKYKVWR